MTPFSWVGRTLCFPAKVFLLSTQRLHSITSRQRAFIWACSHAKGLSHSSHILLPPAGVRFTHCTDRELNKGKTPLASSRSSLASFKSADVIFCAVRPSRYHPRYLNNPLVRCYATRGSGVGSCDASRGVALSVSMRGPCCLSMCELCAMCVPA